LRETAADAPGPLDDADADALLALASVHGVMPLLDWRIEQGPGLFGWPSSVLEQLHSSRVEWVVAELILKSHLSEVLARLNSVGVKYLLLKGTPLAYSVYEQPYLRTRGDTDILIQECDRALVHSTLVDDGFDAEVEYGRKFASYQRTYSKPSQLGPGCHIDLHWRVSNSQHFAKALSFDELWRNSVAINGLGSGVRAPDPVFALVVACLHRATHINAPYFVGGQCYFEANRLIWLKDIDLLSKGFSPEDWRRFIAVVSAKRTKAVCLDGLLAAQKAFNFCLPDEVLHHLGVIGRTEPSAAYLRRGVWRKRLLAELPAMENWKERRELLWEWMFPPSAHMRRKFGSEDSRLLPLLYLRRAVVGVFNVVVRRRR
jgi:hypothetical protein